MDNAPDGVTVDTLSYDDTVPYEEQLPPPGEETLLDQSNSLASRIGSTKVYLLSETSISSRPVKRKHDEEREDKPDVEDEDEEMDIDPTLRSNAILLHGTPISHLPTSRLFAYATHFDAHPLGLEWIDDNTCIFVFQSRSSARSAYRALSKTFGEAPDPEEFVVAKPIPVAYWPPELRIKSSLLDQNEGLKGVLKMRWAKMDDVKKKGARKESNFYKKHGNTAGKETVEGRTDLPTKRRRREGDDGRMAIDEAEERARLDEDLDRFLAQEDNIDDDATAYANTNGNEPEQPASPPSKMRSDYIAADGRTMLEYPPGAEPLTDLGARLTAPLPRRRHGRNSNFDSVGEGRGGGRVRDRDADRRRDRERPRGGHRNGNVGGPGAGGTRYQPKKKTQQELDDELDAFLNERDS
ncbi:hypothetical protein AX16_000921 [Volvariella volvacea WC 439]|nr:hypothetical protein AX16_000921 [Volvariella volvacea WC 439]